MHSCRAIFGMHSKNEKCVTQRRTMYTCNTYPRVSTMHCSFTGPQQRLLPFPYFLNRCIPSSIFVPEADASKSPAVVSSQLLSVSYRSQSPSQSQPPIRVCTPFHITDPQCNSIEAAAAALQSHPFRLIDAHLDNAPSPSHAAFHKPAH